MPGRPPTPIALHKTRGTLRSYHKGKREVAGSALGQPPDWMSELGRKEWERLAKVDHIREENRTEVEHACVLYERFVQDAKGERDMLASERAQFHSIYMQLGLTPCSSAKISKPADKPADEWAALG